MTRPRKRSFTLDGHRTSVSLEAPFWEALQEVAHAERLSLAALVQRIDRLRGNAGEGPALAVPPVGDQSPGTDAGLSGAIRVYLLAYYRSRAQPSGAEVPHAAAP